MDTKDNCTYLDDCVCSQCSAVRGQYQNIGDAVSTMPQFDVPEQLTQSIMAAVATQPARSFGSNFLVPAAVVGGALACTLMPMDSLEGLLSSAIGLVVLFGVQLMLRSARTEEVVA